jgi:murein DD-endopeptidase MepM/ murein hydrolase activator NlpD
MTHSLTEILMRHQDNFHPVLAFEPGRDRIIPVDFTASNTDLTADILNDTTQFTHYITELLARNNARYGIGGYAEHRTVYSRSRVFDATRDTDEPRRVHLGTDIWGKPYTPVMAFMDGIVHSFANNDRYGDYGATIILSHHLENISFNTLYGHLSLNSIKNFHAGQRIGKGDVFAEFGIPVENGQWPPHVHVQIIKDVEGWSGDYPGVCRYSEQESWLANCPDPDLILQLNQWVEGKSPA